VDGTDALRGIGLGPAISAFLAQTARKVEVISHRHRPFQEVLAMTNSDEKTLPWPEESTSVEVDRPDELKFWSKQFRVSPGKLKQTVRAVGPKFEDVEKHLRSRHCPSLPVRPHVFIELKSVFSG
jgi:hypothetical protein